jgi:hypothetical protein
VFWTSLTVGYNLQYSVKISILHRIPFDSIGDSSEFGRSLSQISERVSRKFVFREPFFMICGLFHCKQSFATPRTLVQLPQTRCCHREQSFATTNVRSPRLWLGFLSKHHLSNNRSWLTSENGSNSTRIRRTFGGRWRSSRELTWLKKQVNSVKKSLRKRIKDDLNRVKFKVQWIISWIKIHFQFYRAIRPW